MGKFTVSAALGLSAWSGHEPLAAVCEFAGLSHRQALCILLSIGMEVPVLEMAEKLDVSVSQVKKTLRGACARISEAKSRDYEVARREKDDLLYCINSNGRSRGGGGVQMADEWGRPIHLHPQLVTADDLLVDGRWIRECWERADS